MVDFITDAWVAGLLYEAALLSRASRFHLNCIHDFGSLGNGPETLGFGPDPDRFCAMYDHGVISEVRGCGPGESQKSTAVAFSIFLCCMMFL